MASVLWVNRCRNPGALVGDPNFVFLTSTSRKSLPLQVFQGKNPSLQARPTYTGCSHLSTGDDRCVRSFGQCCTIVRVSLRGPNHLIKPDDSQPLTLEDGLASYT